MRRACDSHCQEPCTPYYVLREGEVDYGPEWPFRTTWGPRMENSDRRVANIERLLGIVDAMGLRVEWHHLDPYRRGDYNHATGLIRLNVAMADFQVEVTLGHELAHAAYGDRSSTPETEARARRLGASITWPLPLEEFLVAQGLTGVAGATPGFAQAAHTG